jgi:tryptophan-rich sensory protein
MQIKANEIREMSENEFEKYVCSGGVNFFTLIRCAFINFYKQAIPTYSGWLCVILHVRKWCDAISSWFLVPYLLWSFYLCMSHAGFFACAEG